jgi:hypothetical protein
MGKTLERREIKTGRKEAIMKPRFRWEDNIKMNLR